MCNNSMLTLFLLQFLPCNSFPVIHGGLLHVAFLWVELNASVFTLHCRIESNIEIFLNLSLKDTALLSVCFFISGASWKFLWQDIPLPVPVQFSWYSVVKKCFMMQNCKFLQTAWNLPVHDSLWRWNRSFGGNSVWERGGKDVGFIVADKLSNPFPVECKHVISPWGKSL